MEEIEQEKSDMEIALEYIDAHPELVGRVEGEAFASFFAYPLDVIKQYEATILYLKTSFGFTDEMVEDNCMDYLSDACIFVQNLKDKES